MPSDRWIVLSSPLTVNGREKGSEAAPNDLEGYYRDHVIGGPGAFLVPARDFDAFADAILSKLLLEVSGVQPDGLDFAAR